MDYHLVRLGVASLKRFHDRLLLESDDHFHAKLTQRAIPRDLERWRPMSQIFVINNLIFINHV